MAYKMMLNLIKRKSKTKEQLIERANVYYACDQLTAEEYADLIERINAAYPEEPTK